MNFSRKLYQLYKDHLPDIILLIAVFSTVLFAQHVPYINLLITSIDPLLTSVVVVWIIFYLLKAPSTSKIITWALTLFVINYFFVIFHKEKIGELFSSLSFTMLSTAIIVELINLKRKLKI